jgi:hypothetical protein
MFYYSPGLVSNRSFHLLPYLFIRRSNPSTNTIIGVLTSMYCVPGDQLLLLPQRVTQRTKAGTIFNYPSAYLNEKALIMCNGRSFLKLLSNEKMCFILWYRYSAAFLGAWATILVFWTWDSVSFCVVLYLTYIHR